MELLGGIQIFIRDFDMRNDYVASSEKFGHRVHRIPAVELARGMMATATMIMKMMLISSFWA